MTGKELVSLMKKSGWEVARVTGSHHIMYKMGHQPISIPVHGNKDLKKGLLNALLKEAGLK